MSHRHGAARRARYSKRQRESRRRGAARPDPLNVGLSQPDRLPDGRDRESDIAQGGLSALTENG